MLSVKPVYSMHMYFFELVTKKSLLRSEVLYLRNYYTLRSGGGGKGKQVLFSPLDSDKGLFLFRTVRKQTKCTVGTVQSTSRIPSSLALGE